MSNIKQRFTPDSSDVIIAENVFFENYNILSKQELNQEQVRKEFYRYNRQYLGYIDKEGYKNILIQFLDFSNRKKAKKYFNGWQDGLVIFFSEYIKLNRFICNVNISLKTLSSNW